MSDLESILFPRRGRRAVVLADGAPPPPGLLAAHLSQADLFVCADAAGWPWSDLPRTPDAIVGDLDTLGDRAAAAPPGVEVLLSSEQQTTDLEKALRHAADLDCAEAVILGASGGLLDHALWNVLVCERLAGVMRLCLADADAVAVRVGAGERAAWDLPAGAIVSLAPLLGGATGVTLAGVRYPLADAAVDGRGPATVSNAVAASPVRLSVGSGSLLAVVRRRGAEAAP